ncbi:MAG: hypothetical protein KAH05_04580 [Clostridiales bacterium]|nr:hypothetical protein [Clostridiales bacterium]
MSNKDILGFGTDINEIAQAIGISGESKDKLSVISLDNLMLFQKILKELKKFNMHLDTITNTKLTYKDVESYKKTI